MFRSSGAIGVLLAASACSAGTPHLNGVGVAFCNNAAVTVAALEIARASAEGIGDEGGRVAALAAIAAAKEALAQCPVGSAAPSLVPPPTPPT